MVAQSLRSIRHAFGNDGGTRTSPARTWLDLVWLLVQRDLRVRYRGSFLGYLWSMMNPLLYMGIMMFVFSHLMRFKVENYGSFILSGILAWNLFLQSLGIGVHSIVANGALLRKVKVPATLFPAASVCSVCVNFVLALGPYLIIAFFTGVKLTGWVLALPLILAPYLVFIFGVVLIVSTLNVRFRDVGHVMEPILTMGSYATPVFYPIEMLPERYQHIIRLNPLAHYVGTMRDVLWSGVFPPLAELATIYGLAALAFVVGVLVYRKNRDGFIYNL
jgi:ABC-type polysaccharide/polyol phosphate export permease